MKPYFYVYRQHNVRTGEPIGKTCGVVFADDEESALAKADSLCGSDVSTLDFITEINEKDGYRFTVYKSSI